MGMETSLILGTTRPLGNGHWGRMLPLLPHILRLGTPLGVQVLPAPIVGLLCSLFYWEGEEERPDSGGTERKW